MPPPSDTPHAHTTRITAETTVRDLLAAARAWGMEPDEFYSHVRCREALASAMTSNKSTSSTLHSRSRS